MMILDQTGWQQMPSAVWPLNEPGSVGIPWQVQPSSRHDEEVQLPSIHVHVQAVFAQGVLPELQPLPLDDEPPPDDEPPDDEPLDDESLPLLLLDDDTRHIVPHVMHVWPT
jgi:hypothetical protein